jgi:hypothetical protein
LISSCFPDEVAARRFRDAADGIALEAVLFGSDPENGRRWEVQCREQMVPTHAAITLAEQRLADLANRFR